MSQLEEKLNTILANPEAMGQIMALARSLGGPSEGEPSPPPEEPREAPPSPEGGLLSAFSGIDPRFLELAGKLMTAYQSEDNERAALLSALRPFVREERYAKLDRAIQITKMTRAIRLALDTFRSKEGGAGHV